MLISFYVSFFVPEMQFKAGIPKATFGLSLLSNTQLKLTPDSILE
jgi:hypothetical protein